MQRDADKWDARFAGRPMELSASDPWLLLACKGLPRGPLLDVACGDGRNAVELAAMGFDVVAADISAEGLRRLEGFAADRQLEVRTVRADFDDPLPTELDGPWAGIVMSRFKPTRGLLRALGERLCPHGRLVLLTFNELHHEATGFSLRFCVGASELRDIAGLEVERYERFVDGGASLDGYVWRPAGRRDQPR